MGTQLSGTVLARTVPQAQAMSSLAAMVDVTA
jgi:hypothetical protein